MRIAMIGPFGFHPNKTMHSRALGLARPLAEQGHAITMIMPPWQTPDEAGRHWQEDGVDIRYVTLDGGLLATTRRMVAATMAWQPDVVHCFKPKAYSGLVAWWLWQFRREQVRLVVDTDDWEGWGGWNDIAPYTAVQKQFFAWQERWGMRHCHMLTTASLALQSIAWSRGVGVPQVAYVPNGPGIRIHYVGHGDQWAQIRAQQRAELGIAPDAPVLLLYSRLFEFDTSRLLAVLHRVQTAVPDLTILSVGAGLFADDAAALRHQLQQNGLWGSVRETGWVLPEALPDLLTVPDVGIFLMDDTLLNRTKCPVKLADQIMAGIPMVGEGVGQVPEYIGNGRSGFVHPVGDVTGVAASVIRLLQDDALRQQMRVAAHEHGHQQFDWGDLSQRLLPVYTRA